MPNLILLQKSTRKNKRFMIKFENPTLTLHFGSLGANTFIDNATEDTRDNYLKRHSVNEDWDFVNPGSLSAYLLWNTKDIKKNIDLYAKRYGFTIGKDAIKI